MCSVVWRRGRSVACKVVLGGRHVVHIIGGYVVCRGSVV